jgi:tellurite resistance protein
MTREISLPIRLKTAQLSQKFVTINNTKFLDTVLNTATDVANIECKSERKRDKNMVRAGRSNHSVAARFTLRELVVHSYIYVAA